MSSINKELRTALDKKIHADEQASTMLLGSPLWFFQDKCAIPSLVEWFTPLRTQGLCQEAAWHYRQLESFFGRHKSSVHCLYKAIAAGDVRDAFDIDAIRNLEHATGNPFMALIAINGLMFWENLSVNTYTTFNTSDFNTIKDHLVSMANDPYWKLQGWLGLAQLYAYHTPVEAEGFAVNVETACRHIMELEPESVEISHWLGNIHHLVAKRSWGEELSKRHYNAALEEYVKVLSEEPDNAKAWLDFARLMSLKEEHFDTADYAYQRSLCTEKTVDSLNAYADFLMSQARHEEALLHLLNAIALSPNDITAKSHLGDTFTALDRVEEAATYFSEILSLKPDANLVAKKLSELRHLPAEESQKNHMAA